MVLHVAIHLAVRTATLNLRPHFFDTKPRPLPLALWPLAKPVHRSVAPRELPSERCADGVGALASQGVSHTCMRNWSYASSQHTTSLTACRRTRLRSTRTRKRRRSSFAASAASILSLNFEGDERARQVDADELGLRARAGRQGQLPVLRRLSLWHRHQPPSQAASTRAQKL